MTISVLLIDTKFPHNIGSAVRAVSCFGPGAVYFTGSRADLGDRLPREERMRAYADTPWEHLATRRPIDEIIGTKTVTPVAVELLPGTESLSTFDHPDDALYVFGPEDGSLPKGIRNRCHRFVSIPSYHCLNLAAAVYVTLYDRRYKRWMTGIEPMPTLDDEQRGWWYSTALEDG